MTSDIWDVHERVDKVISLLGDLKTDVARVEVRNEHTQQKVVSLCKKLDEKCPTHQDLEILLQHHVEKCPARKTKKNVLEGSIMLVKQHPVLTVLAVAYAVFQLIREGGLV